MQSSKSLTGELETLEAALVVPFYQGAKVIQRRPWDLLSVRLGRC